MPARSFCSRFAAQKLATIRNMVKLRQLKVGKAAPELMLGNLEGHQIPLLEPCHQGRSTLLIFLRHLG